MQTRMIIFLEWLLPAISSDLPKAGGPRQRFCSVLLRMGFTYAPPVTRKAVVSYTALPPLPDSGQARIGGIFLLHFPWSRLHRTLSGILPCEARTFLTRINTAAITCPAYVFYLIISYQTLKRLPPINSRQMELLGTFSLSTPRKYSRNFKSRFAS